MNILFEIVGTLFQVVWAMLKSFLMIIWGNLPELLQLKKVAGYFTPQGIVALWLGVPSIIITVCIFMIKCLVKSHNSHLL